MSADARALHLFDELLALSAGAREATLARFKVVKGADRARIDLA